MPLLTMTRRSLMSAASAAAAVPSLSCSAKATAAQFTPEEFGAAGNGITDDYDSFQRLAAAVSRLGSGMVMLRPGAHYRLDRHVTAGNGITDVIFQGCSGLAIRGNSASISVKGDFFRDSATTRGLCGLRFEDCTDIDVRDLQLIGNVQQMSRPASLTEAPTHGLLLGGCSNVIVDGVLVRHFATDGLYVRASMNPDAAGRRRASRNLEVRNSKFLFNARQGLSVIQLRGGIFEDCEFSNTGYVEAPSVSGPYGVHAPGAGIDVEPNGTLTVGQLVDVLTGDLLFRRCRLIGNLGKSFVAAAYTGAAPVSEKVSLDHCLLQADQASASRYGLIFDVPGGSISNCTLDMGGKTAFIGWAASSDASPVLRDNLVTGHSGGPNRPFFLLRNGRGSPLLERNRFTGERHPQRSAKGPQMIVFDNPNATVRDNVFFLPKEAFPPQSDGLVPMIVANARSMTGNRYETDLEPGTSRGRAFGVMYAARSSAANETFRGTRPGIGDTVRPADLASGSAPLHDSRSPWSR